MVEVLFTNSAAGGMLYSGDFGQVVCLDLGLSAGDITAPLSDNRIAFLQGILRVNGPDVSQIAREMVQTAREGMEIILNAVAGGQTVRVWYSRAVPDEYCGFCHLMSAIPRNARVQTVVLPEYEVSGNRVLRHQGWGGVEPSSFRAYANQAQTIDFAEIAHFADQWREAVRLNGPLRAVLNGRLQTVDADFYDCFLWRELEAAPPEFQEAMVIGNLLGRYALGISDWLWADRIEWLIAAKKLAPVTEPEENAPIYHRILRKTTV